MNNILNACKRVINRNVLYNLVNIQKASNYSRSNNILWLCNITNGRKYTRNFKILAASGILTWLGFAKDDEEKESELIMTIKRAILLTQRGEYNKAERMLHLALKISQEQQNKQGVIYVYDLMANLALEREELDKAHTLFVNVLQMLLSQGMAQDDLKVIHISLKMARIYHMKGQTENAETGYQWCLENIYKKLKENNSDAKALNGVIQDWYAQFLIEKGEIVESMKYLKEAYKICTELEGITSTKSVLLLNDLGTASWKMGDLKSAQEYLDQAVNLGKNIDDFEYLGVIYANLGLICMQNNMLSEAKKYCKEGWRLGKKQNNSDAMQQATYCFEQMNTKA